MIFLVETSPFKEHEALVLLKETVARGSIS